MVMCRLWLDKVGKAMNKNYCKALGSFLLTGMLIFLPLFSLAARHSDSPLASIMQQNNSTPLLVAQQQFKLVPAFLKENNQTLHYAINIQYPKINGNNLTPPALHFNKIVQDFINAQVNSFKNQVTAANKNKLLPQANSYLNINYQANGTVSQSQKTEYISVRFGSEQYVRGDAHPFSQIQTLNYDLGHDKLLALADLFKANSNYLSVIANYCMNELARQKLPADFIKTGAAANAENYKNWSLTPGANLVINFNEAQVAPRVYGAQQTILPKALIKNIVTHPAACTLAIENCDGT